MKHLRDRRFGALASAIGAGLVGGDDDDNGTAMLLDLDILMDTIRSLQRAPFPPGTLHTFALKANPLGKLLEIIRDLGLGAEVASLGELRQALAAGFPPHRIVFDSPIKTVKELRFALAAGVRINLDNLQELERVAALISAEPHLMGDPSPTNTVKDTSIHTNTNTTTTAPDDATPNATGATGRLESSGEALGTRTRLIGLRINPQVGEGSIAALSTAGRVSKFGIPLLEEVDNVIAAFRRYPWLNALHLHVGSQGVPLELTVEGVAAVAELLEKIEAACRADDDYVHDDSSHGSGGAATEGYCRTDGAGDPDPSAAEERQQQRRCGCRRVLALDIGGGLPVRYGDDDLSWLLGPSPSSLQSSSSSSSTSSPPTARADGSECDIRDSDTTGGESIFERYAHLLQQRLPALFPVSSPHASATTAAGAAGIVAAATADGAEPTTTVPPSSLAMPYSSSTSSNLPAPAAPQLVTEFGRCLIAKAVFSAGRVEYVKSCGGRRVVVSGLGGDLLLRAVYLPDTWGVRVELMPGTAAPMQQGTTSPCKAPPALGYQNTHTPTRHHAMTEPQKDTNTPPAPPARESATAGVGSGEMGVEEGEDACIAGFGGGRNGDLAPTDVVGPLCFQGDRLAEAVLLPPAAPGDWVVVPDVGAYSLSMYSRYNSRCSPPVWTFWSTAMGPEADGTVGNGGAVDGGQGARWDAVQRMGRGGVEGGKGSKVGERALPAGLGTTRAVRCGGYGFGLLRRGERVEEVMAFWNLQP